MKSKRKSRGRRALLIAVGAVTLFCLVVIGYSYYQEGKNPKRTPTAPAEPSATPVTSAVPKATAAPNHPSHTSGGRHAATPNSSQSRGNSMDAVDAAVADVSSLNTAPFLDTTAQHQLLQQIVAPGVRARMRRALPKDAASLLKAYGYLSNTDALIHLFFKELTTKYKISSFGRSKAEVVLYSVSTFHTRTLNPGTYELEEHKNTVWTVQTVRMEWHGGRWLYVSSANPPTGQSNEFYAKYMEGLKPYVYKKTTNDG
jgi:hypothetical protein